MAIYVKEDSFFHLIREEFMGNKTMMEHFSCLKDPRIHRTKKHNLLDIVVLAVCGMLSKCETWVDIEEYALSREEWFKKFLDLENGIPSHDTFGRVFQLLDPLEFQKCFYDWTKNIFNIEEGEIISLDGKFINGTAEHEGGKSPRKKLIGTVNAWASRAGVVLAQKRMDFESKNEIQVYRELIDFLDLKGHIVTMDAAGCHAETTNKIIEKGGDFCVTLKQNQKVMLKNIKEVFERNPSEVDVFEIQEKGHGRREIRKSFSINVDDYFKQWLRKREEQRHLIKWQGIRSITRIESMRLIRGEEKFETRYILSSLEANAEKVLKVARSHWEIENKLHWVLDVTFDEDHSRVRKGHGAENLSLLRKLALNLVKKEKTSKRSMNGKRLKCSWDPAYLLKTLSGASLNDMII